MFSLQNDLTVKILNIFEVLFRVWNRNYDLERGSSLVSG